MLSEERTCQRAKQAGKLGISLRLGSPSSVGMNAAGTDEDKGFARKSIKLYDAISRGFVWLWERVSHGKTIKKALY